MQPEECRPSYPRPVPPQTPQPPQPPSEHTLDIAERDARCARLRAAGLTYAQIATEVGFAGANGARYAVKRALRDTVAEPAAELVAVETARLDLLWQQVLPLVTGQQRSPEVRLKAVDRALRIMERRARMLGLDAPEKRELRITDGLDAQLEQLADEIARLEGPADSLVEP